MIAERKNSMKKNTKAKGGTKRKSSPASGTVSPTSPVAMGRALVLLATSAAALSGSHPVATSRPGGTSSRATGGGRPHPRRGLGESALRYRDGDEDQPAGARAAGREAVEDALVATGTTTGDAAASTPRAHFHIFPFAMPSVSLPKMPSAPAPSAEEREQAVMDDYLEFVERRYRSLHHGQRVHEASRKPRPRVVLRAPRTIFLSRISLRRSSPSGVGPTVAAARTAAVPREAVREEDPLNVMGLSGLASERLRQRLHVPRDLRDEAALLASSRESAARFVTYCVNTRRPMVVPNGLPAAETSRAASASSPVASKIADGRASGALSSGHPVLPLSAQCGMLLATMQRLFLAFARTSRILVAFARSAFAEILDKGGFRNTVRLAGAASLAVMLMFKPLFRGALRQG